MLLPSIKPQVLNTSKAYQEVKGEGARKGQLLQDAIDKSKFKSIDYIVKNIRNLTMDFATKNPLFFSRHLSSCGSGIPKGVQKLLAAAYICEKLQEKRDITAVFKMNASGDDGQFKVDDFLKHMEQHYPDIFSELTHSFFISYFTDITIKESDDVAEGCPVFEIYLAGQGEDYCVGFRVSNNQTQ